MRTSAVLAVVTAGGGPGHRMHAVCLTDGFSCYPERPQGPRLRVCQDRPLQGTFIGYRPLSAPVAEPEGDRRASEDRGQAEADAGEDQADA